MERFRRTAIRLAVVTAVLGLAATPPLAGDYQQFPGPPADSLTLRIQERVEEVFLSGDYGRALLIYEKELAPLGDKYAQYMVGFMHLTGKGVPENPAEALAWYRLAAERGEDPFIRARDALREMLGPAELEKSDALFADLWQHYGDRRLILDLIEHDLGILHGGGAMSIDKGDSIAAGYADGETGEGYYRRVRARLIERLQYLSSTMDAAEAGVTTPVLIERLESDVRRELSALELR